MRCPRFPIAFLVATAAWTTACADASSSPTAAHDSPWRLVWADEFDGAPGSGVDAERWKHDTGGGGWGNNELQTYTSRTSNAAHDGNALVITARRETLTGADGITRDYTSARILTAGRFTVTYGKIEARLKIPVGKGIWPAFWLLGNDIGSVGWPACGEIDVMENVGHIPAPSTAACTVRVTPARRR